MPQVVNETVNEQFWYSATFSGITNGASSTQNIQIQSDADFVIIKQSRVATQNATTTNLATPVVLVTIIDTGSGRQLMDQAVFCENLFGTAQFPYILPQAKRFSANSTMQVTITNNSGVTLDIQFTFSGFKQYIYRKVLPGQ